MKLVGHGNDDDLPGRQSRDDLLEEIGKLLVRGFLQGREGREILSGKRLLNLLRFLERPQGRIIQRAHAYPAHYAGAL